MDSNSFSKTRGAEQLLRLPEVLRLFPVSRSSWYVGVRAGNFPAPVRIGARSVAWRLGDVQALIDTCAQTDIEPLDRARSGSRGLQTGGRREV
ncbi:MAG: helix-turn-helix transcriptional regulator [Betaproteobacteria bacterium]